MNENLYGLVYVVFFILFYVCQKICTGPEHICNHEKEEMCTRSIQEEEEELFDGKGEGIRWPALQLLLLLLVIVLVDILV